MWAHVASNVLHLSSTRVFMWFGMSHEPLCVARNTCYTATVPSLFEKRAQNFARIIYWLLLLENLSTHDLAEGSESVRCWRHFLRIFSKPLLEYFGGFTYYSKSGTSRQLTRQYLNQRVDRWANKVKAPPHNVRRNRTVTRAPHRRVTKIVVAHTTASAYYFCGPSPSIYYVVPALQSSLLAPTS